MPKESGQSDIFSRTHHRDLVPDCLLCLRLAGYFLLCCPEASVRRGWVRSFDYRWRVWETKVRRWRVLILRFYLLNWFYTLEFQINEGFVRFTNFFTPQFDDFWIWNLKVTHFDKIRPFWIIFNPLWIYSFWKNFHKAGYKFSRFLQNSKNIIQIWEIRENHWLQEA